MIVLRPPRDPEYLQLNSVSNILIFIGTLSGFIIAAILGAMGHFLLGVIAGSTLIFVSSYFYNKQVKHTPTTPEKKITKTPPRT
jgi:hypothetical protein